MRKTFAFACAACAIAAATTMPAQAQQPASETKPDQTADESASPYDIVVTAQRRAENVQDVPISIVALSGAKLDAAGVTDFSRLTSQVPGMIADSNSDPKGARLGLRGVTSSQEDGKQSSVGVFVDGIFMSRVGMAFSEFQDIERIEVLRGPQGTLFGMNTAAGLIHIVTARPNFTETTGFIEGVAGNKGRWDIRGLITGPISENWAYSLSGFTTHRSGLIYNDTLDRKVNNRDRSGVRAKLAYSGNDIDFQLIGDYQNEESDCCTSIPWRMKPGASLLGIPAAPLLPAGYPYSRISVSPFVPYTKSVSGGLTAELNWHLNDALTLTSLTGWRDWNLDTRLDPGALPIPLVETVSSQRHRQFSQEIRLTSDGGGPLNWVAGLFFFDRTTRSVGELHYKVPSLYPAGASGITTTRFRIKDTSYAGFGQVTYDVTDKFKLSIGGRYSFEDQKATQVQAAQNFVDPNYNRAADRTDGQFTFTGNASYHFTPDVMAYATIARGFKPGGFDLGRPATYTSFEFESETNLNTEIGLRTQLLDRKVTFNLTAFSTTYKNFQTLAFDGLRFLSLNAPEFVTRGVELELNAHPTRGLSFTGQASYVDAHYTDFVNGACPQGVAGSCNLTGRRLHQAPRLTLSSSLSYESNIGQSDWKGFGYIGYSYRSGTYSNQALDPFLYQKGYGLVDLRVGIEAPGQIRVEAWVNNLFDKDYMSFGFNSPLLSGGYGGFVGDERMYGLRLRKSF